MERLLKLADFRKVQMTPDVIYLRNSQFLSFLDVVLNFKQNAVSLELLGHQTTGVLVECPGELSEVHDFILGRNVGLQLPGGIQVAQVLPLHHPQFIHLH